MTTDPLVRRFNPTGPNYGPNGLDTPGRDAERRWAFRPVYVAHLLWTRPSPYKIAAPDFGTEQGGGLTLGGFPPSCSPEAEV